MAASIKTILIGLFVVVAFAVVIFMLLFLHPSVGDNAKTLHVRFTNIDKVNIGTRVTYAGKPMGEVVDIRELQDARTERLAVNGQVYVYELTLNVDSGVNVFNSDIVTLRTSGLLGERNIDISPEPLKPGQELYLVNDEILYAVPAASVEDTLKQFEGISKKVTVILNDVHHAMDKLKKERVYENIGEITKNAAEITSKLNQPEKLDKFVNNLVKFTDSLNESWVTVDKTINEFHTSSVHFRETMADAKKMADHASQGEGTIGRLFMKDDLYLRLKSVLSKGDTVAGDIKQYGILFQTDKKWQRINAKRQKLLQKLSKPELFAEYFNNEMDQISTSLSKVSLLLNETECYPDSLYNNPDFTLRFAELMRRVTVMEEALNMYNEQVVDQSQQVE